MPIYEFKCRVCNTVYQSMRALGDTRPPTCPCGSSTKRVFSPPAINVYQAFETQGVEITSDRQHRDHLKAQSEAQESRTGIPSNYVPVHPADAKEVYGITEEGLDTTYRREVAEGKRETQLWL